MGTSRRSRAASSGSRRSTSTAPGNSGLDPLYWRPPGGESICDVAENRVRNFLETLHRECSDQTVLAVTHGEFIRATRIVLERIDDETFTRWETDPAQYTHNCAVFHYTRVVPDGEVGTAPGRLMPRISFLRRAHPVLGDDGVWRTRVGEWQRIQYSKLTIDELTRGQNGSTSGAARLTESGGIAMSTISPSVLRRRWRSATHSMPS